MFPSPEHFQGSEPEDMHRELARELHDQVAQSLTTMLLQMEAFKGEKARSDDAVAVRQLELFQSSTREVLDNVRQLLEDLRGNPGLKDDFVPAIRNGLLRRFQERTGIRVRLSVARAWPEALPERTSFNLYRIIQEALSNAWLHSGARSVRLSLGLDTQRNYMVTIRDDGNGFSQLHQPGSGWSSSGVLGMQERAVLLGGDLRIESLPGKGTTVRATFPAIAIRPRPRRLGLGRPLVGQAVV